jgi:arsenate reductase
VTADVQRHGLPGLAYPDEALRRLAQDLTVRFEGVFSPETVQRCVLESYTALLRTSIVTSHLVANTSRFARDRLGSLARAMGAIESDLPEVLYVCEQNAGRSQMAAVLTRALAGDAVLVRSAGSAPAAAIHADVVTVMAEIGLDLDEAFPKPLTDDVVQAADVVVSMGCGDACPVYPGKRYRDWELRDPSGATLDEIRAVRDDIRGRVEQLLAELGITSGALPDLSSAVRN